MSSIVPIYNNRIPAKDLGQIRASNMTNERADLAASIARSQERLKIHTSVRIREEEMVKLTVRFLVKFDALLKELG